MPDSFRFRQPVWLDETPSTSDYLKNLLASPEPPMSGTVIAARRQTAGRGRMGASWLAARDGDLLFSFIYTASLGPEQAGTLPLACGLGVRDFLAAAAFRIPAACKWPNDILVEDGKICGILTEGGLSPDGLLRLVIGIGINVHARPGRDEAIGRRSVSLKELVSDVGSPEELLPMVLGCLEERVQTWTRAGFAAMRQAFVDHMWGIGLPVTVRLPEGRLAGTVSGLGDHGELMVTLPDGTARAITSVSVIEGV